MATKNEIRKTVYALGRGLGMDNEDIHALVYGISGKEHISELTDKEFFAVRAELMNRMKGMPPAPAEKKAKPKSEYTYDRGRLSEAQAKYIWRLMYQLESFDEKPCDKTLRERLAAIIRKELNVPVIDSCSGGKTDIFRNVSSEGASKLIEQLKRYVASAERKAIKRRASGE